MFDIPESNFSGQQWDIDPQPLLTKPWNVGLITGPSGCGKSTVARHLFADALWLDELPPWPKKQAVVDGFSADLSIREVTEWLSAVGFSSPPAWLRPYSVLSTGQRFRCDLARLMASLEPGRIAAFDEFTSVVDRTVAQIGSAAVAKAIRRKDMRFVAVTCHEDVIDWLQPDWILTPSDGAITWRALRQRPHLQLDIFRTTTKAWPIFAPHHYLAHSCSTSATCFAIEHADSGRAIAFSAWVNMLTAKGGRREHRTVVLPDWQGVGIGMKVSSAIASMWKGLGHRATSTTTHPAFIAARRRSPDWAMTRAPSLAGGGSKFKHASTRLTAGFEYIGPAMDSIEAAKLLG